MHSYEGGCVLYLFSDDTSSDCHYVDLLLNPERYTGYKGESAHRVWNSIYKENCFKYVILKVSKGAKIRN